MSFVSWRQKKRAELHNVNDAARIQTASDARRENSWSQVDGLEQIRPTVPEVEDSSNMYLFQPSVDARSRELRLVQRT